LPLNVAIARFFAAASFLLLTPADAAVPFRRPP